MSFPLLRPTVLLVIAFMCVHVSANAKLLNLKQRGELFSQGTITDDTGRVWDIRIIPGVGPATHDAGEQWKESGRRLRKLGQGDFYRETIYKDEIKEGFKFSKESITKYLIKGVRDDFKQTRTDNAQVQPGDWGRHLIIFVNWSLFACTSVGRTVTAPIGTVGGAGFAIIAPVATIAWHPAASMVQSAGGGVLVPALEYIWTGTAWIATSLSPVPKRENLWVHLKTPETEYLIDAAAFDKLVQSAVASNLTTSQAAELQKKVNDLQTELEKYRRQKADLDRQLHENPAFRAGREIENRTLTATRTVVEPDVKKILKNDADISERIKASLRAAGISDPTDEQVLAISKSLRESLTTGTGETPW